MGAGLGGVPRGKEVFMVIKFKGEITATEASGFNTKLMALLKEFREGNTHGGSGFVTDNNADEVVPSWGDDV